MINYKQQCCKNSYKSAKEQKYMEKEKQANQVPCLTIIYVYLFGKFKKFITMRV